MTLLNPSPHFSPLANCNLKLEIGFDGYPSCESHEIGILNCDLLWRVRAMPTRPFRSLILRPNGQKSPKFEPFKNEGIHEMTLPLIRLSDAELTSGNVDLSSRLLARQVFSRKGVLVIENAFEPEFITSLRNAFATDYAKHLFDRETDETLKVGDKRLMIPVEIAGAFNAPHLYANPFVFPLVHDILGASCILGSFGAVIALPGADDQHVHRDHPFLFHEEAVDTLMSAFAVNVIVPLVDINDYQGTTRVWPGSHRIWADDEARQLPSEDPVARVGSCMLMDYRLLHGGTVNRSEQTRPMLYLSYHRPWFKDYVNFTKVRELLVPVQEHRNIPEAYQAWFRTYIDK